MRLMWSDRKNFQDQTPERSLPLTERPIPTGLISTIAASLKVPKNIADARHAPADSLRDLIGAQGNSPIPRGPRAVPSHPTPRAEQKRPAQNRCDGLVWKHSNPSRSRKIPS